MSWKEQPISMAQADRIRHELWQMNPGFAGWEEICPAVYKLNKGQGSEVIHFLTVCKIHQKKVSCDELLKVIDAKIKSH